MNIVHPSRSRLRFTAVRRGFTVALIWAALSASAGICGAQTDPILRSHGATLEVERANGAIRMVQPEPGIALEAAAGRAENFRLVLLKPDKSTATILGKDQKLTSSQVDGETMTLRWDGPLTDKSGAPHDVSVRMTARAADRAVSFDLHVENRSAFKVQQVSYPYVGGIHRFGARPGSPGDASLWAPTSTPTEKPLGPASGGVSLA